MGAVGVADLGELVVAPVGLVGQADAALEDVDEVAVAVAVVGVDVRPEEAGACRPARDGRRTRRARPWSETAARAARSSSSGSRAAGLDGVLVHERGPQVTDLLGRRSLVGVLGSPPHSSMIARTCSSAITASWEPEPQDERSEGISSVASQRPFTWPKRSSCGRVSGSIPARASSSIVMAQPTPSRGLSASQGDAAVDPDARGDHADLLVEAEGAGPGVGAQLGDRGTVRRGRPRRRRRAGPAPGPGAAGPVDGQLADVGTVAALSDSTQAPTTVPSGSTTTRRWSGSKPGRLIVLASKSSKAARSRTDHSRNASSMTSCTRGVLLGAGCPHLVAVRRSAAPRSPCPPASAAPTRSTARGSRAPP